MIVQEVDDWADGTPIEVPIYMDMPSNTTAIIHLKNFGSLNFEGALNMTVPFARCIGLTGSTAHPVAGRPRFTARTRGSHMSLTARDFFGWPRVPRPRADQVRCCELGCSDRLNRSPSEPSVY